MLPKIVKKEKTYNEFECYMCGGKLETIVYNYQSAFRKNSFTICKKCAIRETYGTKGTSSKKYKKAIEKGRLKWD